MLPNRKWKVSLKQVHDQTGKTPYAVAKESGVSYNTVKRFADDNIVYLDTLSVDTVVALCDYYGVLSDIWQYIQLVEYPEDDEESDEDAETGTPLAEALTA